MKKIVTLLLTAALSLSLLTGCARRRRRDYRVCGYQD